MPRAHAPQLNIRSRFARERASRIAAETGFTVTEVVEEALRAYQPPPVKPPPGDLTRKGPILVKPGGRPVTLEEVNAIIDEDRSSRGG